MKVKVIKLETSKCPRCYLREGVLENFMELCDRCCHILLDAKDDLVKLGRITQEEADNMVVGIKEGFNNQLAKYKVKE